MASLAQKHPISNLSEILEQQCFCNCSELRPVMWTRRSVLNSSVITNPVWLVPGLRGASDVNQFSLKIGRGCRSLKRCFINQVGVGYTNSIVFSKKRCLFHFLIFLLVFS